MIIVFVGAPGSGKGTHARRTAERCGLRHVSTGDLLRDAVERKTDVGLRAKEYMDAGKLVPDEVMMDLVSELLDSREGGDGVVFDGFPRTLAQAEGLDRLLAERGLKVDKAMLVDISEDEAVERMALRISCPKCGAVYNLKSNPPGVEGVCDKCGGKLEVRSDDREETVRDRFKEFRRQTQPVIDYYRDRGILASVRTSGPVDEVARKVAAALDGCGDAGGTSEGA
ncbi:MAG: adenylate kinase [Candidatus Eisenbacteria bacterium]|nr:adenylate kinase [Candidatus Eisenbacteria bacterium]